MKKNFCIFYFILLVSINVTLYAQETITKSPDGRVSEASIDEEMYQKKPKKYIKQENFKLERKTIIVLKIQSVNCPEMFGSTITEIIKERVRSSNILVLKRKSQMDLTITPEQTNCNEISCAVDAGNSFGVKKVIIGTITKEETNYTLKIDVVDVEGKVIEINVPSRSSEISDFEKIIDESIDMIERTYYGVSQISGKVDLGFGGVFIYPFADMTKGAGLGGGAYINTNVFIKKPWGMLFSFGLYGFKSEMISIRKIFMMPVQAFFSYTFLIGLRIRFIPAIGGGFIFSYLEHDYLEYRPSGDYNYQPEYFINPIVSARAEIDILLKKYWYLVLTPFYSFLIGENARKGHTVGVEAGIKILF